MSMQKLLPNHRDEVIAVKVKPLVWGDYPNRAFANPEVAVAEALFSHKYQAQRDPWANTFMVFLHPTAPIGSSTLWWESKGHPTLNDAKTAAQDDYEARIMSVIAIQPDPRGEVTKGLTQRLETAHNAVRSIERAEAVAQTMQGVWNKCTFDLSGAGYDCVLKDGDARHGAYGEGQKVFWDGTTINADGLYILSKPALDKRIAAAQPAHVQPDPRDEVIARLVDAMHTISGDIQINADGEEELSDAARIARAALAAAKAVQS